MKANAAILDILDQQGVTQATLANRLGIDRRLLNRKLHMDNPTMETLKKTALLLGYKIVLMPDTQPTPKGGYDIE